MSKHISKKLYIFVFLIIVVLIVITISFISKNLKCDALPIEAQTLLEKANYCNVDADCVLGPGFNCPFGCGSLVNINADLSEVRAKVKLYEESCTFCLYDCGRAPYPEEIKCKENKCIAIIYP